MSSPGSRKVIDFLQASPVFAGLPARELESLAATAREESCRAPEYIFHEGDPERPLSRWSTPSRAATLPSVAAP